jgi:ABC-type cobalt transport system substrate-binding protein
MDELRKITGYNNRGHNQQWRQLGTTSATVAILYYAVIPVYGNAVLSVATARGGDGTATDALTWIDNATKTFYQNVYYPISGTHIRVTSGEVIIYLREG